VDVGDEAGVAQRCRAQATDGTDVDALEHRVHRQPGAGVRAVAEADRLAVDDHEVDLRVRDAEGLDDVLDGLVGPHRSRQRGTPRVGGQEVVQLSVGPDLDVAMAVHDHGVRMRSTA
jgi:hypothetical protein